MNIYKELREKAGFTQAQVATALGVHVLTVSKWERGTCWPSRKNEMKLRRLCDEK